MTDKILIVEDDFANGIAALAAMKEFGFDAIVVGNAEDAIKSFDNEDFLAVLTDMNMPLEKGGLVDKEAGKVVIKESINRCVPSAVVTGGIGHHGEPCIKVLLPEPMFAIKHAKEFSFRTEEIRKEDKSIEVWKRAWATLKEFADSEAFHVRQRYRKYLGKPFKRKGEGK